MVQRDVGVGGGGVTSTIRYAAVDVKLQVETVIVWSAIFSPHPTLSLLLCSAACCGQIEHAWIEVKKWKKKLSREIEMDCLLMLHQTVGLFFLHRFLSLSPRVFFSPFFHIFALTASSSLPAALVARRHDPHERTIRLLQDNRRQAAEIFWHLRRIFINFHFYRSIQRAHSRTNWVNAVFSI